MILRRDKALVAKCLELIAHSLVAEVNFCAIQNIKVVSKERVLEWAIRDIGKGETRSPDPVMFVETLTILLNFIWPLITWLETEGDRRWLEEDGKFHA